MGKRHSAVLPTNEPLKTLIAHLAHNSAVCPSGLRSGTFSPSRVISRAHARFAAGLLRAGFPYEAQGRASSPAVDSWGLEARPGSGAAGKPPKAEAGSWCSVTSVTLYCPKQGTEATSSQRSGGETAPRRDERCSKVTVRSGMGDRRGCICWTLVLFSLFSRILCQLRPFYKKINFCTIGFTPSIFIIIWLNDLAVKPFLTRLLFSPLDGVYLRSYTYAAAHLCPQLVSIVCLSICLSICHLSIVHRLTPIYPPSTYPASFLVGRCSLELSDWLFLGTWCTSMSSPLLYRFIFLISYLLFFLFIIRKARFI